MAPTKGNKGKKKKSKQHPRTGEQQAVQAPSKSTAELVLIPKVASGLKWLEWRDLGLIPSISPKLRQDLSTLCSDRIIVYLKNDVNPNREYQSPWIGLMVGRDFKVDEPDNVARYDLLIELLSKVNTIAIDFHDRLATVFPELVARWAPANGRLHQVHIDGGHDSSEHVRTDWYYALSAIPSLRILHWLNAPQMPPLIVARNSLLQRVTMLIISNYKWELEPLFRQTGPVLKTLMLAFSEGVPMVCNMALLELLVANNTNIGRNLTSFTIKWTGGKMPDVVSHRVMLKLHAIVCKYFEKIEVLHIAGLEDVPLQMVLAQLAGLSHLRETTLDSEMNRFVEPMSIIFAPFNSIRTITLGAVLPVYYTLAQFKASFARLFPQLQTLNIRTNSLAFFYQYENNAMQLFPQLESPTIVVVKEEDGTLV